LELAYAGKDLSMIVFVPRKVDGLAEFERTLTADKLDEWLSKLKENEIDDVALPKFKLTTGFELGQTLSAMGMPLAFTNGADFSAMSASERLFISKVIHQAFVDVNEEGTEAAAATGIEMRPTSFSMFVVDHPFVFLIRDNRSGSLLFMGRVTNPLG
jgi:serpin B